jgi:hypothetical protein
MFNKKKNVSCNFCGEISLRWEKLPEGWKLVTPEGNVHKCQTQSKPRSDDYPRQYNNHSDYKKKR